MDLPQQLEKGKEKLKPLSGAHLNFALKRPSPETGRSLGTSPTVNTKAAMLTTIPPTQVVDAGFRGQKRMLEAHESLIGPKEM
ncbi:hypothetical protein QQF64_023719 [Cirrhinus molitorella]|uniref:Uncharacterized protein n=1 Tax=Cirrhinus molitorella TaxID=172907 RepID=A0ABR3NJ81_9TELE